MIRWIKSLFGIRDTGYEYWINTNDINIKPSFLHSKIGKEKYASKWRYYRRYGYCESPIILDKNFTLLDGYSSYVIYKIAMGGDCKVPVYFIQE